MHLNSVTISHESGKATLVCNVTNDVDATNPLQIKWYNSNGVLVEPDEIRILRHDSVDKYTGQVQSSLLIDPLSRNDSGNYTCQAINDPLSFAEATSNLVVQCE